MRTGVFGERVGLVGMMMVAVAVRLERHHRLVMVPLPLLLCRRRLMSLEADLRC
jgi:hypothetical protein